MIKKIISGGQTGVDRAALDVAIKLAIPYGGWCPKGRIDEQGIIPDQYRNLQEITGNFANEQVNYNARTCANIHDADGTLILVPQIPLPEKIKDGTLLTIAEVKRQQKPYLMITLADSQQNHSKIIIHWLTENNIETLNIAGPRESNSPGIYQASITLLTHMLIHLKARHSFI